MSRSNRYHGLPNLFLPEIIAVGESLNGLPFALVAIPPGKVYEPGPGDGSDKSCFTSPPP